MSQPRKPRKPRTPKPSTRKTTAAAKAPAARRPARRAAATPPVARLPEQSHGAPHAERRAAGKALRERVAREVLANWQPDARRADPVDLLVASSAGRVPELLPIRYGRMMASPFAFYRGAAAVMAHDLSFAHVTGLSVVACGDCHLMNFGGFATPERRLVFDINDFDEVSVAPWEWDVARLAASFVIAGRANGFRAADCREAAWTAARSYRENMARYAEMPVLDAYYEAIDLEKLVLAGPDEEMKRLNLKRIRKAQGESAHLKEYTKLTVESGGQPRIRDEPPLIFHYSDLERQTGYRAMVEGMIAQYVATLPPERRMLVERYRLADVAVKVVGVGSVGTYCGIALMVSGNGDPLFLQFKEARASVLEPYCGRLPFAHSGERVVFGQRLLQAGADIFLGWMTGGFTGKHFYVRQLRDAKIKPMVEIMKPVNLRAYASACGWALARAHKRTGDAVMLTGYLGASDAFEDAMTAFAARYADRNEQDHAALVAAVRAGRVEARAEG
ncbi:MAG: DUF2252 domain-containing protein [Betaproteobacteria bacterium]|nr:DUF2252 domain-containing protein [Betaproteobacteria bacterium]